jgi:hypothetical protein
MRPRRLPRPLAVVLALTAPSILAVVSGCTGVPAGPPLPMSTSTAEGLALADATVAELRTDDAMLALGFGAHARNAKVLRDGEVTTPSAVKPVLAAWGWRGGLPASCTRSRDDGALVLDCARAQAPARRVTGVIAFRRDAAGAETSLRAEGLTVATTWADGRSRTRRFDGTAAISSDPDGTVRVARTLAVRTEIVREYGTMVSDRETRTTLTYRPDSDVAARDPAARGVMTIRRASSLRVVAPNTVRIRSTSQETEVPLHWDRACRAQNEEWLGFDEGVLTFRAASTDADRAVRSLRIVFAGCGPGAATLDGEPVSLAEAGDLAGPEGADADPAASAAARQPADVVQTVSSD